MLRYNFTRIFKAKGIDKPFSFLRSAGFSDNFATKVNRNRINRLDLKTLERLCIIIGCTPNDILEWTPSSDHNVPEDHPIYTIKKPDKIIDMTKTLNSIPITKLEEIDKLIHDHLKEN